MHRSRCISQLQRYKENNIGVTPLTFFKMGIMASKSSNRSLILRTNLVNHTNFGPGLFMWVFSFDRFFSKISERDQTVSINSGRFFITNLLAGSHIAADELK